MAHARIIIDLDIDVESITEEIREAFESLAGVMHVQAEDGLYLGGHEDADLWDEDESRIVENTFFGVFNHTNVTIEIEA